MAEFRHPEDNFIVTAPNYKTLQQSTLPPFLDALKGWGQYNKTDSVFKTHWGTHIWMRTCTEPDSVVGIPRVRGIWGDEAGKFSLYFWENMQGRASPMEAQILLTTSPYTLNWIYKDLIKPASLGKRSDVNIIRASSWENPYHSFHDPVKLAKARATMDRRRFDMIYGGEWGRMAGLVYDCVDFDTIETPMHRLPNGTRFVGGVDWGYNPDPFVLKVRAITPEGMHFAVSEFYKTGMTISDMVMYAKQVKQTWGVKAFYCDPSQPGSIEEFNRNGLGAIGADNDINRGVGLHYELIKTGKFKIFQGTSPQTIDELETYHYPEPESLTPDQDSKEQKPVGQNDHCMDVDRYITIETYRSYLRSSPHVNDETAAQGVTQESRLQRLKKLRGKSPAQTESWDS